MALEERKLQLQAEKEAEEGRQRIELEEKKLILELEDRKMGEFELKKLAMQDEIISRKMWKYQLQRRGMGKNFYLLQLLKSYDNANGGICMYLTLFSSLC